MRDELEAPFLDEWFYETEVPPPDPKEGARRVASRLPHTKQVGRWLPFPVFRRKAQTPTATDTTDYQPTSIPATNGHTPTVLGRTQSMFSPVKAITAGAIVFALGGVLLIAQPFDQQGSVPGAATDEEPSASRVTGVLTIETVGTHEPTFPGGFTRHHVEDTTARVEMADTRLSGDATFTQTLDVFDSTGDAPDVTWGTIRIENDGGTWDGTFAGTSTAADESSVMYYELVGSGDYEGWSAILFGEELYDLATDTFEPMTLNAALFPGDLPPER